MSDEKTKKVDVKPDKILWREEIDLKYDKLLTVKDRESQQIIKELELNTGRFPEAAMKAAIEQRDAITPELLRTLEAVADDPAKWAKQTDFMLPLLGVFLLAQFREKRAYPLIARIVSTPGEVPFDLFGDTITEGLCQIFGSVYDGNPGLLEKSWGEKAITPPLPAPPQRDLA